MRTMYDAVTAANIPAGAQMVAGYIDKIQLEPWSAADWARFPNAVKVTIVKKASTNDGHVLDVEPGDAGPGEAPGWVRMRRAAGADPTIYCNLSTWPTVRSAFSSAGVAEPHYWIAHYNGDPAIPDGAIAKQYRGDVAPGYDVSSVADYWPGVDGNGSASTGVEIMERITVTPPNANQNTVRVFLSGSPGAAIVIRPRLGGDGFSKPMWVGDIFAWGNDHQGVGHNPTQVAGYNNKLTSHRRYDLPGAVWADINYSAADPFELDIVG
ncbi:hypothetical protein ABZ342_35335 [Amycolatopsis sp. NPDC005961]|uniref:hypothetical protein n=1 Tax=Amycolatopsis sp. NPDC005961 TaxID=3156720 RepID=UPI0033D2EEAB